MDRIAMLFLTGVGIMCLYAGYKLFCGLPAINGTQTSRTSVFLLNIVPGALLALIGTGILAAEARNLVAADRPLIHRHHSGEEGASWHRGGPRLPARAA
jgi:hypothetical protein